MADAVFPCVIGGKILKASLQTWVNALMDRASIALMWMGTTSQKTVAGRQKRIKTGIRETS